MFITYEIIYFGIRKVFDQCSVAVGSMDKLIYLLLHQISVSILKINANPRFRYLLMD